LATAAELAKVPKSDSTVTWNATALASINTQADLAISDAALATAANLATVAGYVDTEVAAILAAVDTEVAAIKAKTDNLPAAPAATGDIPTAAAVADAVWDEALAGHAGAGSSGLALSTASSGGVDPSVLADAIWDEALSGHATAGTTGKKLTDLANADLSGVATASALATVAGYVDTEVAAVLAAVDTEVAGIVTTLGAAGAGLTALATAAELAKVPKSDSTVTWNATALASINTQADLAVSDAALATAANLATVAGYIDTEVASILAAVDTEVAAIKAKTDNLPAAPVAVGDLASLATAANLATVDTVVDGIATTLGASGAGLTALGDTRLANLDATVSSRLAPAGTLATVTNLTNAPTAGDLTATMKTSVTTAATAATPTAAAVTGAVGSVTAGVTLAADAVSAAALSAAAIDEILDEQIGDGTLTMRQALRVMVAAMAGKVSGAATTSVTIRNVADSANVVVATVTADGDRTAVTVTP
jgi:hypothetical protein